MSVITDHEERIQELRTEIYILKKKLNELESLKCAEFCKLAIYEGHRDSTATWARLGAKYARRALDLPDGPFDCEE